MGRLAQTRRRFARARSGLFSVGLFSVGPASFGLASFGLAPIGLAPIGPASFGLALWFMAAPAFAQTPETLADIRQDLTVLHVEIQKLKRELSTTGGATLPADGAMLERVSVIETALQQLTAKTEELEYRITRIVEDGTNRIGDLEFRLVELEGGDVSQLSDTTTLGGATAGAPADTAAQLPAPAPGGTAQTPPETAPGAQMAVGESADFQAAEAALLAMRHAEAAGLFARFNDTYPGSPLAVGAHLGRGDALGALGDTREAARAYLDAYNAAPTGARAPEALLKLGQGLGALGQIDAACQILAQVSASFATAPQAPEAQNIAIGFGCS